MFRHFSFESTSLHPSLGPCSPDLDIDRASMNVSPTSTPVAPPPAPVRLPTPPPCSLGELAQRFHRHSLRVEVPQPSQSAAFYEPLTPPSDDCKFAVDSPHSLHPVSFSPCISSSSLRARRQANTRLQCSAAHIRDISLLVEKMIDERDQCSIRDTNRPKSTLSPGAIEPDEDEGVDMDYAPPTPQPSPPFTLKFRRSSDRSYGHACVSKNVRMRKKPSKGGKSAVSKRW
jgi:hypothetical protein